MSAIDGAFDQLLLALDPDRERAGTLYESLRERLISLLDWWGSHRPDELADLALDRAARKLQEGADVPRASLEAYVRGVARMIHIETFRQTPQDQLGDTVDIEALDETDADEPALDCLDGCLETLDADDRSMVLEYYASGKKSENRQRLADSRGLSSTALRIRTCRLRDRLEACVNTCLDRK